MYPLIFIEADDLSTTTPIPTLLTSEFFVEQLFLDTLNSRWNPVI
jgi:hypothetical protein